MMLFSHTKFSDTFPSIYFNFF